MKLYVSPYIFHLRSVVFPLLYEAENEIVSLLAIILGDPWEGRTPDCGVRGHRLDRLTNGPCFYRDLIYTELNSHFYFCILKKKESRHRLIFPGRLQPSIFSTRELNYRVRNGNGWILAVIDTDYSFFLKVIPSKLNNHHIYLHLLSKSHEKTLQVKFFYPNFLNLFRLSPRPISISQLNMSPCLHL